VDARPSPGMTMKTGASLKPGLSHEPDASTCAASAGFLKPFSMLLHGARTAWQMLRSLMGAAMCARMLGWLFFPLALILRLSRP
jgi:hypothetical protein